MLLLAFRYMLAGGRRPWHGLGPTTADGKEVHDADEGRTADASGRRKVKVKGTPHCTLHTAH